MSKKIISLTIDSNCINAKVNLPYMKKIESVSKKGLVEIYKTSNMDTEFFEGKGYQKGLSKSKDYKEDIGPGTWGVDRLGHFNWGSKFDHNRLENIKSILFKGRKNLSKKQIRDCKHLQAHIIYDRDFFITSDKHFLNNSKSIKNRLNAIIMNPEDFYKKILNL
jgi:hypothetical protein